MDRARLPSWFAAPRPATLVLQDGRVFRGFSAGAGGVTEGEVVFNTSMFGYQEMLTDPSYHGQILVLTTPHVGNVGVNAEDAESARPWVRGLIVPDLTLVPSNWRAEGGLLEWLDAEGVPVAWGFDTRALVLHVRDHGALPGVLACGTDLAVEELRARAQRARGTDGRNLVREVGRRQAEAWTAGPWVPPGAERRETPPGVPVVVVDCGAKRAILRQLVGAGATVVVVPADTPAADLLALKPAGVVISNGPGDPAAVAAVPATVRQLLGRVPLLGICLGHQLLALALGGRTYKLRFGHHGGNHPVREAASGSVWITSQNHNYAVDADSLPALCRVTLVNLTDASVEGIAVDTLAAEGIQFHPEAGPGPHDALGVFQRFVDRCRHHVAGGNG